MLRWSGDFTLNRLRAKLANKYLLHPDVEPGYDEVYRPELGESTIVRKDYGGGDARRAGGTMKGTLSGSQSSLGRLGATSLGFGDTNLLRSGYSTWGPGGSTDMASTYGSIRSMDNTWGSGTSLQGLTRTSSVPSIGVRRAEVPPASLRAASGRYPMQKGLVSSPLSSPPAPSSPTMGEAERKELEKEKNIEAASRRLWSAAHGSEVYIKEQLVLLEGDPKAGSLARTPVPGMQKALKQGAKLDWRCDEWDGATLLVKSVRTNSVELVMYLLAAGADPSIVDKSGRGVFHWAAIEGNPELMEFLLTSVQNLKLNQPDVGGDAPLHLAAYHGHMPVVRQLIRAHADPNLPNAGGFAAMELGDVRRKWHISHYLSDSRLQEDDRAAMANEAPGGRRPIRELVRSCNVARANELRALDAENPKPKPKPKADPKKK